MMSEQVTTTKGQAMMFRSLSESLSSSLMHLGKVMRSKRIRRWACTLGPKMTDSHYHYAR